jgi:3-methyladenine DNA glycosylase AlkC
MEDLPAPLAYSVPDDLQVRDEFRVTPADELETLFRHTGWIVSRERVFRQLVKTATAQAVDRFANCGGGAQVQWSPKLARSRVMANYCHHRWCRPCSAARGAAVKQALRQLIKPGDKVRLITFTLRSVRGTPLQVQVDRLRAHFDNLRHRKIWKENVTGAVKVWEVKRAARSGGWHPHLHVLQVGNFIDQKELSALWWKITGDSDNVDIRSAGNGAELDAKLNYMVKYATKPAPQSIYDNAEDLAEMMLALKGLHMFDFLGSFRGINKKIKAAQKLEDPGDWVRVDSLSAVMRAARSGQPNAIRLLAQLCQGELPLTFNIPPPS